MHERPCLWLCAVALLACGGSGTGEADGVPDASADATVPAVTITPETALLVGPGETLQLEVAVFDVDGNPADITVGWSSSKTEVVTVEAGRVTAEGFGTAQVSASFDGARATALIVVAAPVAGAILIDDADVRSGPEPVDGTATGLGAQLRTTLSNRASLRPGDIILGTGDTLLGGRVVEATPMNDTTVVTWEVVPLDQLFDDLVIDETLALDSVEISSRSFHARPNVEQAPPSSAGVPFVKLGAFDCTASTGVGGAVIESTVSRQHGLGLRVHFAEDELRELALRGTMELAVTLEANVSAELVGSIKCELELVAPKFPLGGPFGVLLGGTVPISLGFEIDAKTIVAQAGSRMTGKLDVDIDVGYTCSLGSCADHASVSAGYQGKLTWVMPDPSTQLNVRLTMPLYTNVALLVGVNGFRNLQLELATLEAGTRLNADLRTAKAQLENLGYESGYGLQAYGVASPGAGVQAALARLGIAAVGLEYEVSSPLAQSPTGTLDIPPTETALAVATVTLLTGVTFLSVDNITEIQLLDATGKKLATADGVSGRTTYEISFNTAGTLPPYTAFAVTYLLTAWPLELDTGYIRGMSICNPINQAGCEIGQCCIPTAGSDGEGHCVEGSCPAAN